MNTPQAPTIEIPRLDGESSRAYEARVRYIVAGPRRSLDSVAQELSKSRPLIARWSKAHGWVDSAAAYDQTLASLVAHANAEQYRRDLEDHRERYQKAGKDLYAVSLALLQACARAIRGQKIKGADGQEYLIPAMELTPASLSTAMRGLQAAGDLEAHALRLADLLPQLDQGDA